MPELPEVESVRRELAPVMVGARVRTVDLRRPDLRAPFPRGFARRIAGQTIVDLIRRAKYLLATLSSGDTLLMHLGMSGSFRVAGTPGHGNGAAAGSDQASGQAGKLNRSVGASIPCARAHELASRHALA